MALTNLFSSLFKPKQPVQQPVLQSKAPNMSTNKGPVYAAPSSSTLRTSSSNAYSMAPAPKPTPKPTYTPTNPVSAFGQQAMQGKGITALQNMVSTPKVAGASAQLRSSQPSAPNMSVNKPAAYPIASMADGGVKYSDGSVKYPNGRVSPTAPTTTTTPSADTNTSGGGGKTMAQLWDEQKRLNQSIAQGQTDFATKARDEGVNTLRNSYDLQIKNVLDQIPFLEQMNESEKSELLAAVEDLKKAGALNKENINAEFDKSLRQAAQSKRQTDAQRQNTFAALGTLDSGGAMGFTGQQQNADEEFLAGQQETLRQRANKISSLEIELNTAERQAKKLITEQSLKFNEQVRQIRSNASLLGSEKEAAIRAKYLEFEGQVQGIQDQLAQMQYNVELQKTQYTAEMQKLQAEAAGPNLSDEFIRTGVPQTKEDFIYRTKNPEAFEGKMGVNTTKDAGKQEIRDAIQQVFNSPGGLGTVFGYGNVNPLNKLPGSDAQATKAAVDRLKSLVSLENANKLKGQGSITDAERQMLANAATLLNNPWISPEQAQQELNRLYQQFGGSATPGASSGDPLGLGLI